MSTENMMTVRRAVDEVWNGGNYDVIAELATSDIVIHSSAPEKDLHGPEAIKQFYGAVRAAFPDIHFTIEDQFAGGDRVATRWSARATHTGEFGGIPPTNRQIRIEGTDIDRFASGKVVECWTHWDELSLLQQLGAVPLPKMVER
jgi:steroid delta-isomerase-like uncharacterized protein